MLGYMRLEPSCVSGCAMLSENKSYEEEIEQVFCQAI